MFMFMEFELTFDEINQLKALDAEMDRMLIELYNQYPEPEQSEARSQAEIELNREYYNISSEIRRKARKRSLKYYASHISELVNALHDELRNRAVFMYTLERADNHLRTLDMWKKNTADSIAQYLALLSPILHLDMLKYIDYVFNNREKIYRDFQRGQRGRTGYEKILNGPGLNTAMQATNHRMKRTEKFSSTGIEAVGEQIIDDVHIELSNFDKLKINDNVRKLFHILTIGLTKQIPYEATTEQILKGRRVSLSLDEYMNLCGLTDRKEARKQLRSNAETLYNISLEFDEKSKIIDPETGKRKYRKRHWKTRLLDIQAMEEAITDSKIIVYFTIDIADYLSKSFIMPFNLQALTIDTNKYRHAYALQHKLSVYYNLNRAKHKHIRISVKKLLKACPDMPTPEEVKDRHYKQQIIDPLEKSLIAIRDVYPIIDWHYCNSGGKPLTVEQQEKYDFNDWQNWLVEYTLLDSPEQPKLKTHRKKKDRKTKVIALPAKTE